MRVPHGGPIRPASLVDAERHTGIVIQPVNCSKAYWVAAYLKTLGKNGIALIKPSENTILKFRCIIFKGYFNGTDPLFIVDKISKP